MRKILVPVICLLLALGFLVPRYAGTALDSWSERSINVPAPVVIHFPKGAKLSELARDLAGQGVVNEAWFFYLWVRWSGHYQAFQAGDYRFAGEVTPRAIAHAIETGDIYVPIVAQFTIPEGFAAQQIIERIAAEGLGSVKQLEALIENRSLLAKFGITARNAEGYLFPATYQFTTYPSPEDVIRKMVEVFWQRMPDNYREDIKHFGLTLQQAIIFASLIEKEAALDDEKPMIAEVIWNRLKKDEPLGIDAAVIYGIEDYHGDIKFSHLRDPKNAYNTRIHRGLPPGPICSPTTSSLKAVLNPTKSGYYYYVLIPGETKRHYFSRSLDEHNRHVQELVRAQKINPK